MGIEHQAAHFLPQQVTHLSHAQVPGKRRDPNRRTVCQQPSRPIAASWRVALDCQKLSVAVDVQTQILIAL